MSEAKFQLAYDGEGVRRGSMDVYELAPALLAVGDLIRDTNEALNGKNTRVQVSVESDFRHGSFEVSFLLDQSLLQAAKDFLFAHGITDAAGIVKLIFGGTSAAAVLAGLFKLYKALKGEKPIQITYNDNSTTIIQTGSGTILRNVERITAQLYQNEKVRDATRRVLRPLAAQGIDTFEVREDGQVMERITRDDVGSFVDFQLSTPEAPAQLTVTRHAILRVASVSFEKNKWRFSDGGPSFPADVNDKGFLQRLDTRVEGFYKGDLLRVELTTVQDTCKGKLKATHSIDRVIEHIHTPEQTEFPKE